VARWFRWDLSVAGSFVCRCLTSRILLRFLFPLIEPDRRISRIRPSDKDSCYCPRNVAVAQAELDEPQRLVQVVVGEVCISPPQRLVFTTQPPMEPFTGMVIDPAIGVIDRTLVEVIRPTHHHLVESADLFFHVQPAPPQVGPLTDPAADCLDLPARSTGRLPHLGVSRPARRSLTLRPP
jgi:hypothetical protein